MAFEQFLDWVDDEKHAEWVYGKVIVHRPVPLPHAEMETFLVYLLMVYIKRGADGTLVTDPFLMRPAPELPCRAPDIAYVTKEHRARLTKTLLDGPADLVVEIVSPGSRGTDRGDKYFEYERGGIREYWLIDPERQVAEFYLLGADGRYALAPTPDGAFRSEALPGFWIKVAWLWQDPLPTERAVLDAWAAA